MIKKQISSQNKQFIIEEITSLLKKRKNIAFVYLYGSFVRDEKFSDIDIGIFVSEKRRKGSLKLEFDLEEKIQSLIHLPVDVRTINHAPLSFVYKVIKEGVLMIDKIPPTRADFEGIIFKKYLDFAFFRRQYLKEVINAPI